MPRSPLNLHSPDACFVHLVRHGATRHNEMSPRRLQGAAIDEGLSEDGRTQAGRTAEYFAGRPIQAVYASPMLRAMQTAQAIADRLSLSVAAVEALREVNVGRWEGMTWDEIQARDADAYSRFREQPLRYGYPDGESVQALIDRVSAALGELVSRHAGGQIVVVAHSAVNRSYLASLLGVVEHRLHAAPQDNCGVSMVRSKNGRAKVISLNAVGHLD